MNVILILTLTLAVAMMVVTYLSRRDLIRLRVDLAILQEKLNEAEKEKALLQDEISHAKKAGGVGESTVLALIGEMSRMDNNLYHMQDVPGRKQVVKALDRMKVYLQAEDYTIVSLLGTAYKEGMQVNAVFVPDDGLPVGSSVITSVQKPQVNKGGKMIQAASVTVAQNV